jgi:hypothetical protein
MLLQRKGGVRLVAGQNRIQFHPIWRTGRKTGYRELYGRAME